MPKERITVSLDEADVKLLDQYAEADRRNRSSMLALMIHTFNPDGVKPFNGAAASNAVTGKAGPDGKNATVAQQPKVYRKPGPKSQRPPFLFDPRASEEGRPAFAQNYKYLWKQYFPRPGEPVQSFVPVKIVCRDGEPIGVKMLKHVTDALNLSPDRDEDEDARKAMLATTSPYSRADHQGYAVRFETVHELLAYARELGPTDDWIDADDADDADDSDTQPVTPKTTEQPDDSLDEITGALSGVNA